MVSTEIWTGSCVVMEPMPRGGRNAGIPESGAELPRDTVVISFLFLERTRRKNESLEKRSAEALSTLPTLAVTYGWNR